MLSVKINKLDHSIGNKKILNNINLELEKDKKVNFLDLSSNISASGAKLVFIKIAFNSLIILPLGMAIIILDIILRFYI